MIISAVFGFHNVGTAYYQMGYASIIWYIIAAVLFFLPASLMFAEYGSAIQNDHGGIYTWLKDSIGDKWAFIGTFIWICDWIINLVSYAPNLLISFSTTLFGADRTGNLKLLGLSNPQTMGILSIVLIIILTWIATLGLKSVTFFSSLGGLLIAIVVSLFCVLSVILIVINKGALVQPVHGIKSFIVSPNPQFQTPLSIMSFIVYAVFAYGGIESVSGIIDKLKNPEKTFPRAMIISAILMTLMYSVSIFLCGFSINWGRILGQGHVNLANILYVLMYNFGTFFSKSIGLSATSAVHVGYLFSRFTGFATFLGTLGAIIILTYSPIKSFIMGSPKRFWPRPMVKLNRHQMPAFAMWVQSAVVCVILFSTAFGGTGIKKFYSILVEMNNVASVFPYLFLVAAFPFFKRIKNLNRPFVFYKNRVQTNFTVGLILVVLVASILFNLIQPLYVKDYMTAFWNFIGPVFFTGIAYLFYSKSAKKESK